MRNALLTTTAMLIAMPATAMAQAPSQTAPQAAASEGEAQSGLTDIIVTAQRRAENSQRAAVAIDVVKGSDLIAAGVTQVDRLGELAPALTVQKSSTGSIIFMRGVGNFTVSANSDPAIAFNYDGVYIARSASTTGMFFDLDRIEVLKGPQGTLYGRNATGGAINIIPTQPKLGVLGGYATATYGNYNALTAEAAINIPMGENGAIRVSGSLADRDGYLKDGTSDDKSQSLRVQMKAELTPSLTVRIAGDYSHTGGIGSGISYAGRYDFSSVTGKYTYVPSNIPLSEGMYSDASQSFRQTARAGTAARTLDRMGSTPFQKNNFYGANAEINYDTGAGTLTLLPAWRYSSQNYLAVPSFLYRNREKDEEFSLEARFQGKRVGIFDYTLGVYYFRETIDLQTQLSLSSAASFLVSHYKTDSYAPFGRLTAHLSDSLRLVGGVRYTDDKKHFYGPTISGAVVCLSASCPTAPLFPLVDSPSQFAAFPPSGVAAIPFFAPPSPAPAGIIARSDRQDNSYLKNSRVTYRAAVEYDIAPKSLFYASFESGYRSGGFSPAQGFETFQPEYLDAYTVGVKNRFLDNRVQLNVEGFYWKYRDQQINHVGLDLNGRTANFTQNIGRSTIKGIEVEGQFLLTPTTLFSTDIQYLDAVNKAFKYQAAKVGAPGTPPPAPPLTGCAVTTNPTNASLYDVDCAGLQSYNSPKWTINLAVQQTINLGDNKIVLGADTQYKGKRNVGFQYLAEQTAPSVWLSNAQISFGQADDKWSISAYVRNIENNRTVVYSSLHPTANLLINGTSAPRTYGVRTSIKF